MNKVVEPEFEELGVQLGRALRSHVAAQRFNPPEMGRVRSGAKRRRAVHRGGVVLVCLALIAAAGLALTHRVEQTVPGDGGGAGVVRPPMLAAYAILEGAPGVGQPVSMWAQGGGAPRGVAVPQIDVWQSGDQRLVIRTVDNSVVLPAPGVTTSVVATIATATSSGAPWADRQVTELKVRGVDGAIAELAADQFAVWIPTSPEKYTLVIGRYMSRDEVLADVEALLEGDGVLRPSAGFELVESAAPLASTTPASAFASVSYDYNDGPFVSTNQPPAGRASIETASWHDVGRLDHVGGRQAMFIDGRVGNPASITWLDPTGLEATVTARLANVADLVPFVRMITEDDLVRQGADLSHRVSQSMTEDDRATVGGVTLTGRHNDGAVALCVAQGEAKDLCVAEPTQQSPESITAQAVIEGHWVIFGYRQIMPGEHFEPTIDDLEFTSSDGSCCTVESTKVNDAYWYVAHVADNVDVIDTNVGMVFGGIVGSISRPIVASEL